MSVRSCVPRRSMKARASPKSTWAPAHDASAEQTSPRTGDGCRSWRIFSPHNRASCPCRTHHAAASNIRWHVCVAAGLILFQDTVDNTDERTSTFGRTGGRVHITRWHRIACYIFCMCLLDPKQRAAAAWAQTLAIIADRWRTPRSVPRRFIEESLSQNAKGYRAPRNFAHPATRLSGALQMRALLHRLTQGDLRRQSNEDIQPATALRRLRDQSDRVQVADEEIFWLRIAPGRRQVQGDLEGPAIKLRAVPGRCRRHLPPTSPILRAARRSPSARYDDQRASTANARLDRG